MERVFSKESEAKIEKLLNSYPDRQACLLPVLYIAQDEFGCLTGDVMALVARRLELPPERVANTATFYTMYDKQPVGKYHVQVCVNVPCFLRGSDRVLHALEKELNIGPGETTEDGLFTLSTVQCLASCGTAPTIQVNDAFHEAMSVDKVHELIKQLREEQEE